MSANTALLPPKDNSDSGMNTIARAAIVSPRFSRMSALTAPAERHRDADRRQHQHHPQHRPAQDPNADDRGGKHYHGAGVGNAVCGAARSGRQREADRSGGDAVEDNLKPRLVT